jgi:hypothetical protein
MRIRAFTFVDLYDRALDSASHLLDKGVAFARERGVAESDMLDWRLIDDMQPLRFQLMVVANFAGQWPARVAGLPVPETVGADMSAEQFQAAFRRAKAQLAALTADAFEGRDEVPITFRIGDDLEPTMPAGQWLAVFATTNLHFHLSTAYGILRSRGVAIGKVDLFANRL